MDESKALILIVDDEAGLRFLLQNRLEKRGFAVEFAGDGLDAWTRIENGLNPSLIVSDMKMPGLDGIELLTALRERSAIPQVPFIMMTGFPEKRYQDEATRLGASEIFIKPFSYQKLVARIEEILNSKKPAVA